MNNIMKCTEKSCILSFKYNVSHINKKLAGLMQLEE